MLRSNKFLVLLAVTVLVVAAAVVMTYRSSPTVIKEKEYVFPGLVEKINEVAKIEVTGKDGGLTVKRFDDRWVIEQADNYPASFSKIRQIAVAVADLKILAAKTSNPDLYEKLGVEDPDGEKAKSKRLTLTDSSNGELASLIVGSRRTSGAPGSSPGYYIRIPGQSQALLVEGDLNVSLKTSDWIEAEIINIDSKHVREVVIDHPDGSRVQLSRAEGSDDFQLADIPEGKETQSSYTLNRAGSILANVRADDVRAAQDFAFPDQPIVATVKTFDGMTATIKSTTMDDSNWVWFEFDYQAPVKQEEASVPVSKQVDEDVVPEAKPTAEETVVKEEPVTGGTAAEEKPAAPPEEKKDQIDQKQVEQMKLKTAGWIYKIPSYKFELFTRKFDDLVKDIEPEEEGKQDDSDPETG